MELGLNITRDKLLQVINNPNYSSFEEIIEKMSNEYDIEADCEDNVVIN